MSSNATTKEAHWHAAEADYFNFSHTRIPVKIQSKYWNG